MALFQRKTTVAITCLVLLCGAALLVHFPRHSDFDDFLRLHGKQYAEGEYEIRRAVYAQNELFVKDFNTQSQEVKLSLNWMADLSEEEYREMLAEPSQSEGLMTASVSISTSDLPAAVDWTQLGAVTGVKDQRSCGSCYAFSATGAVESAYFLNSSRLISLSEQELVDCSKAYGNHGCHGGKIESALRYIRVHGIMQESQYPYVKYDHECLAIDSVSKVFISDIIVVPKYDQMQLKAAVAKQPLAIALEADQKIFQFYQSGVLGRECGSRLTHAALLVGYGTTEEGVDYWLVKNSWGRGWGEHGYVRLLRTDSGKDSGPCGITLDAYYPII